MSGSKPLGARLMSGARERRTARYRELRDSGMRPADAIREVGLANHGPYERWYRSVSGQPPRDSGLGDSGMKPARFGAEHG